MDVAAISAIPRVAAPYPARIPMLEDTRPAWDAERVAQNAAARQAQRAAQAATAWEAQRVARLRDADPPAAFGVFARNAQVGADAPRLPPAPQANVDALRDQYADARMRRAVDDFSAQPDPLAQRAGSANDLGTIEGLTPLQPYRVAMGNPQVQEWQAAVAMKAASAAVPAVANIGATENVTDNARYRSGFAPDTR
ncbi:hypothetical protein [Achromobacter marplatensis]|uniref:hypothetical protein n=1 Tax=Achromobacter marplatensis TaxID=470868 RepID=UPI0039F6EA18